MNTCPQVRHAFPVGTRIIDHAIGATGVIAVLSYDDDDEPIYGCTFAPYTEHGLAAVEYLYEYEFDVILDTAPRALVYN